MQRGKDLSELGAVIGTGGPLASGVDATTMLAMALADPAEPLSLRPQQARLLLDRSYILYACGLLATVEPEAALALALTHIKTVGEEAQHERSSIG